MVISRLTFTLDCQDAEALARFWCDALGYSARGPLGTVWMAMPPESENAPWIVLQQVPEPRSGKNRMHLDLHVDQDLDAEVRRLEELGAQRAEGQSFVTESVSWVVMSDPEGNEFCVVVHE